MKSLFTLKTILIILFAILFVPSVFSQKVYVKTTARTGDGISNILDRHSLPQSDYNINKFKELNKKKFDKNGGLLKGKEYDLPIIIINNKKTKISKATGITKKATIDLILEYNLKVEEKQVKTGPKYILWIPMYYISNPVIKPENTKEAEGTKSNESLREKKQNQQKKSEQKKSEQKKSRTEILFGPKYEEVPILDNKLQNSVFYLVSGHGGPDPGAVGKKDGHELCEDEYSYDVILRLARNLMGHSAEVYVIVQDSSDGIRDDIYLRNSTGEVLLNGDSLSSVQTARLGSETALINQISSDYNNDFSQYSINIHLDSRQNQKRIDIFFYYQDNNKKSKSMANTIYNTIKHKYDKNQPGRGYKGSVTTRDLFMLRNTKIPTVYIELGNIKNPLDQIRFVDKNNRQAISNWITDGIIKEVSK